MFSINWIVSTMDSESVPEKYQRADREFRLNSDTLELGIAGSVLCAIHNLRVCQKL